MQDIDRQLFAAAKDGDADSVAWLIRLGANAKAADFMGVTPLMIATLRDYPGCVEALLPFSDAMAVDGQGATALIYASQHQRLDCAKLLVSARDMERREAEGLTAMDHTRAWGDMELLSLLESLRLAQLEARLLADAAPVGGPSTAASRLQSTLEYSGFRSAKFCVFGEEPSIHAGFQP